MKKGDRVKLSKDGLTVFSEWRGLKPQDRRGVVVSTPGPGISSGCVRVQWDGFKGPQTLAMSFLEIENAETGEKTA